MAEDQQERINRELLELLNELRIALPGVQVLFAFLLAVPFSQRFDTVSVFERDVYFVTLLCAAGASALLIAPSSYHRLLFRARDKAHMIFVFNALAIAGTVLLALAMTGAVLLITHVLFDAATAIVVTAITGAVFASLWYALPLQRRWRRRDELERPPGS